MMPYRLQQVGTALRKRVGQLRGMTFYDRCDLDSTVLLAGSGRSGTTWLGQIINHGNHYRDVFEPFHPAHVAAVSGWPYMKYLNAEADADRAGETVRNLLAGRVRSCWTDAYNRKTFVRSRMVKAIRTNLMLGWVRIHCPQVRLLFTLRHPCAVVHSRVKLGWETHLDELLAQPMLLRNHLERFHEPLQRIALESDAWDRHLAMWCIENLVPLRELQAGDAHVLFYEHFCDDFDREVNALFGFLERAVPDDIGSARRLRSAHFRRDSPILCGGDLIADWQKRVTHQQLDQTLDMLDLFGLSHLYDERGMPRCSRDQALISLNTNDPMKLSRAAAA